MTTGSASERSDFFLSRRGSVAAIAREVADVLAAKGYSVVVQDYDIPINSDFVAAMHEGIKNARDLVVLFTGDYESSPHTRREFTSFEADRAHSPEERRVVILRCEDVALRGLFAPTVYQDLVGVDDPEERRARILAAVEGRSQGLKPPPRPFVGVPPRIASFTGRGDALERLDAVLMGGRAAAVTQSARSGQDLGRVAVQGMGGVGKTSLAVEYAYRYRDLFAGVWWCPAESRAGLIAALAALAVDLGAATAEERDIEKAAKAGLRRLAEQRALHLLVYDNVTSPDDIADFLPASGARVLITSRFPDWAGWAEEIPLDVLPLEEAVACLQTRAARTDHAGAVRLAEALGCLPLALDHAAATCRRTQMPFADYAARAAGMIAAAPRGAAYPRSVAATFDLAIASAVAGCPDAGPLMTYLAACAPERIPMSLVDGASGDPAARAAALLALSDVSLVRNDPFEDGTPAVMVHRLVQAVARQRAGAVFEEAATQVIAQLTELYPFGTYKVPASWVEAKQLTPHVLVRCQDADAAADTIYSAALLDRAGSYLRQRAAYADARPLLERALAIRERLLGDDTRVASSLNNLSLLLSDIGDFAGASDLLERAVALRERLGEDGTALHASTLDNLGMLRQARGDLPGARQCLERALAIRETVMEPTDASIAMSLNNLAVLLWTLKEPKAALPLYQRAHAIFEAALGPEHPHTSAAVSNVAVLLRDEGRAAEAEPMLRRAIAVSEKIHGRRHPDIATQLSNLACLVRDFGRLDEAETLFAEAIDIGRAVRGADHPLPRRYESHYARLLVMAGRNAEALERATAALAILEAASGTSHPWTRDCAAVTADALAGTGRTSEADDLRRRYGIAS